MHEPSDADTRGLIGRDVAFETLRPQLADDLRVAQRFWREAKIRAQLEQLVPE